MIGIPWPTEVSGGIFGSYFIDPRESMSLPNLPIPSRVTEAYGLLARVSPKARIPLAVTFLSSPTKLS